MKQILVALVEDKPGVLNRIASLFRRRNYNIESIAAGHSEVPGTSRLTIVTDEEEHLRRNIIRLNLLKLVNVIDVVDVTDQPCVIREHALIKVKAADGAALGEVRNLVDIYRARIVDVGKRSLIVEVTGEPDKIDSIIEVLEQFEIIEIMRTGKVALTRGDDTLTANGNGYAGQNKGARTDLNDAN